MHRPLDAVERLFEKDTALALRDGTEIPSIERQGVEGNERRGRRLRELRSARGRRVQPQLQRLEIEPAGRGDYDLAVDDAAIGQPLEQRGVQLGKVAIERPQVAALDEHFGA